MSLFIHTDVTAVKFYQNYVLAGIGSSVNIYLKESFKFLDRLNCLRGQKIYGLLPLEDSCNILVFGGKQYAVITLQLLEGKKDELKLSLVLEPMVCNDWLHSATWLNKVTVALLTAHNTVQIWDVPTQTLIHQYVSLDNSILYSGLLLPLQDDVLVFAGTVYSEVIIHTPKNKKPLHNLKGHRGVIFSIACLPEKQIIVSTSDDRSVRIWGINLANPISNLACNSITFWRNVIITCKYEVYGHTARVMRSFITKDLIISVGEDSAMCFWNYEGKLLRKNVTHQNSAIWSVDADTSHVVTGGGDGAVILHPIAVAIEHGVQNSVNLNTKVPPIPKKIAFTARKNLIVLDEGEDVIHYVNMEDNKIDIFKLDHGLSNKYLSMSSCKQLIAIANMSGKLDVFAESCKDEQCIINIVSTNLSLGTVLSMQWAGNRNLVFCNGSGTITVLCADKSGIDVCSDFVLPPCKQRWLTAAAMNYKNNILIVGDRCGNIHVFAKENKNPLKTFSKVHGRYGPTSINIRGDEFITTGRDGTIKYFLLNEENIGLARYTSSKDLEFQWVEKFIDKEENVVCGFKERVFVVYDLRNNLKCIEVPCGGGHRAWDVVRYIAKLGDEYDEFIRLIYVKNNNIFTHTFQLSKVVSRNVINSSHSKEINCLKSFKSKCDNVTYFITGGEDTTLRITSLNPAQQFRDEVVFKHLSNVRALKIFELDERVLVVSAGGRAQICVKLINTTNIGSKLKFSSLELTSYLIKGTDKERKNNQTWKNYTIDFDPETRIMDLDMLKLEDNTFLIFAGCSDSCLRVFSFSNIPDNVKFEIVGELQYHKTCILKTTCIKFFGKDIVITCTTRGEVSLWDVTDVVSWESVKPFFTMRTNKCGINAIAAKTISHNQLLIVTGGDDNAIYLTLLEMLDACLSSINVKHSWSTDKFHCSQVTGVLLVEDALLSTSIDQRVTLSRWSLENGCEFQSQTYSDVADIQGMELLSHSSASTKICVFGKGVEVIEMRPSPDQ